MQVAPFLHCPTQSSISFAHVRPLQPSKHEHVNAPGVFVHDSALMHGPNADDRFDSHSFTSMYIHSKKNQHQFIAVKNIKKKNF